MAKKTRSEVLEMFGQRAQDMIARWPAGKKPFDLPQGPNRDVMVNLVKSVHEKKPIASVLDIGCGLGRWAPFWTEGIGAKRYSGIEPVPALAAEAERRYEARPNVEIIQGDIVDFNLGRRRWDLGFTFTVLEHVPPENIKAAVANIKSHCGRLILIEMVAESREAKFCEHVFRHDHVKLFGEPSFTRMLDDNKAVFIYD